MNHARVMIAATALLDDHMLTPSSATAARLSTFTDALVALIASSALVMAGGMPLEAALRTQPPVERYAAAKAVVTVQQVVDTEDAVVLGERAPVRQQTAIFLTDGEAARLAGHPGWVDAIGCSPSPASTPRACVPPTAARRC
jgi:hypothetical protein